ncbi:hypothetical protein ABPG74_022772 [Tetrahymena malaccensis]
MSYRNLLEFSFREFLYYLQVSKELFNILEQLDLDKNVQIIIKVLRNTDEINIKQWKDIERIQQQVSITDIDLDNGIIYVDSYQENNDFIEHLNEVIQDYVNQFEIETIKPQSLYEPFIEKLSLKYQFAYIKIKKSKEQKAIQDSRQEQKGEQSNRESDLNEDEYHETIILMRKRIKKEEIDGSYQEVKTLTEENDFQIIEKSNQESLSLKKIAKMIEEENLDRYRQFDKYELEILDKIIYLVNEFQLDQKIFNKYNVFIEIQDDQMDIIGDIEGKNIIDRLVDELKQNLDFVIKSENMPMSKIQQMKEDIDEQNQEFLQEKRTQITLLGITFDVYSKLIVHGNDECEDYQDKQNVKISYINFKGSHEDILQSIFKEKPYIITLESNKISRIQEEFFNKYGKIDIKQYKEKDSMNFHSTERRYKKFQKSLKDERESLMVKEDFGAQQILFNIFIKEKKEEIKKLQSKYKFTIILEPLGDSNQNQICLICPYNKKDKIKKKIEKYLKEIEQDVTELTYELEEDDLEMFSQKGDYLMQEVLNSKELDESDKQEEEELFEKNLKNSQIYLQYYLSDIIYQFENELLDLQRQRSNKINKNFKIILSQNELQQYEENQIIQKENIQTFQKEISILMISIETSYEEELKNILLNVSSNLIIIDHQDNNHYSKIDALLRKNINEKNSFNQIKNMFSDLNQQKQRLLEVRDQQVLIGLNERQNNEKVTNKNSLVLVGQNLVDSFQRDVNKDQFDNIRNKFFNDIFQNAIESGIKIHIMVEDKELRSELIQILLQTLGNCQVQKLNEESLIKIYFIQRPENQKNYSLKKINTDQIQKQQPQQGEQIDIQKAEEEIENTLQIFKCHQKDQSKILLSQVIESAKWYFEEEKEGKISQYYFDEITCLIFDYFYRDYLDKRADSLDKFQNEYEIILRDDSSLSIDINKQNREVRINFKIKEVIFTFLNISISFNLFFKFYPYMEQIIKQMSSILDAYEKQEISLYATQESAKLKTLQDIVFEEKLYNVIFDKEKYYIQTYHNLNFQPYSLIKKKIYINRQALVSESNFSSDKKQLMFEKVHIKYNFKREEASYQQEMYPLKLLVEKQNVEKAKKNLNTFFDFRKSLFKEAKQKQKEKTKMENSLLFCYYTPKLKRFLIQLFRINKYTIVEHQEQECKYLITSDSKTSIKNFEKNEISYLEIFQSENWLELLKKVEEKTQINNIQLSNTNFFLKQLSSNHTQYLCFLKNWEIPGFKPYFFLIYNQETVFELQQFESTENANQNYEIAFQTVSTQILFKYLQTNDLNLLQEEEKEFYSKFEPLMELAYYQQDINILVFLKNINKPIFYLLFQK